MASLGLDRVGKLAADLEHVSLVVALPTSHDDIVGATPILEPMSDYRPPLRDIRFTLDHIARLDEIVGWAGFEHVTPEVTERILDEAGRFMADIVAPLDRIGDIEGATRHPDGSVTLPDGFRDAYSRYVAGQWNAVKNPAEYGGHGFPEVMGLAVQEMLTGACMAFSLCPMLTQSAALLVERHGSDEQKAGYLPNLISGRWTGTMVLSEPQAGSDLGAVRTRAEPHQDGTWRINGSKIFITWGEHDLAENIIHFVLARAPDSPPGTRGLSLFMVPKFLPTPDGKPGVRNEVECVSIEHKVGIHASPTCVMSFGQDVGATGYLLGNLHQGIRAMFTMMNDARLNVGLEGLGTTERVLQQAGDFASERRQGRAPAGVDAVPIVEHPDVRRMLATIRAHSEAMRGLLYDNAARFDAEHHHGDPDYASRAGAVGRLLTPVSKAWCTDLAVEMASLGIQVHGGMGYVEETGAAQLWRDSRISPIYEGTNGIQAIDLVMRKLPADGGTIVRSYLEEIDAAASRAAGAGLSTISTNLHDASGALAAATEWLLAAPDPGDRLAGASPYLRMFGTVAGARYLTDAAVAAVRLSNGGDPDGYYRAKIATADFFTAQILPGAKALVPAVTAGIASLESGGGSATLAP